MNFSEQYLTSVEAVHAWNAEKNPLPFKSSRISAESFMLRHGREWPVGTPDAKISRRVKVNPQQCFDNAFKLAKDSRGTLRYVEGYACGVLPIHHAWCVDANGVVADLTSDRFWTGPKGHDYFGVVFNLDFVAAYRSSRCQSMFWNFSRNWALENGQFESFPDPLDKSV